ncbi:hypothetical protein [Streptomyces sp. NPDC058252]|uniref:hypothetical protein n=1 Tax=Streptomyces sp. NPDC058252 TaxID=3346405 RepID=UPI0036EE7692
MTAAATMGRPAQLAVHNWNGHWHGYGPWTGSPAAYHQEGNRRPAHPNGPPVPMSPEDKVAHRVLERYREGAAVFSGSDLPPLMTGHWLQKSGQASADRTWTNVIDAVEWLKKCYTDNPPFERTDGLHAYVGVDVKVAYAYDVLPGGVDVTWVHYTPAKNLFSLSVVCCPNRFHPRLACPLPPS